MSNPRDKNQQDRITYESMRAAWLKALEPRPDVPLVLSPSDYALAEDMGIIANGRVNEKRLYELFLERRENPGWGKE